MNFLNDFISSNFSTRHCDTLLSESQMRACSGESPTSDAWECSTEDREGMGCSADLVDTVNSACSGESTTSDASV